MKIVTWNVNGIRSFDGKWKSVMESFDADIICVQETKVTSMYLKANEMIRKVYSFLKECFARSSIEPSLKIS